MKISSSYKLVIETTVLLSIAVIFFAIEQGITRNVQLGTSLFVFLILFLCIRTMLTDIRIENNKTLINKVFLISGFTAEIKNITRIGRSYEFIFKNWGCRMEVYYLDEYNLEQIKPIQESIYTIEDIKELLRSLKEINPSIKLHQHYQDLIDGKIEDESKFKKMRLE